MFKHDWRVYAVSDKRAGEIEAHKVIVANVTKAKAISIMKQYIAEDDSKRIVITVKAVKL